VENGTAKSASYNLLSRTQGVLSARSAIGHLNHNEYILCNRKWANFQINKIVNKKHLPDLQFACGHFPASTNQEERVRLNGKGSEGGKWQYLLGFLPE
jgi:hypothetical protein